MKSRRPSKVPPEKQLCILAREFRGTRDKQKRESIAGQYAEAVGQLISSKKWKRIPALEDQLPDEWMPEEFFSFWSLQSPARPAGRKG